MHLTILYPYYYFIFKNKINLFIQIKFMLKLRLKRAGRKRSPSYRLVIMESATRRDGRPVEELGYYNPITKQYKFDVEKIKKRLNDGVKPTETVAGLLKKADIIKDK